MEELERKRSWVRTGSDEAGPMVFTIMANIYQVLPTAKCQAPHLLFGLWWQVTLSPELFRSHSGHSGPTRPGSKGIVLSTGSKNLTFLN